MVESNVLPEHTSLHRAREAAERFQLFLPGATQRGVDGGLAGRGTGSSVEFQDFREYIPGDDVRHIDWVSFARTDKWMVRLFREEIAPRVEIFVDASRSMAIQDWKDDGVSEHSSKENMTRSLAMMFCLLAKDIAAPVTMWWLGDAVDLWPKDALEQISDATFTGRGDIVQSMMSSGISPRKDTLRIIISDFMFAHDPDALHRKFSQGAGYSIFLQVLASHEQQPKLEGQVLLEDAESGAQVPVRMSSHAVKRYKQRLELLQKGLSEACRRSHSPFAVVNAGQDLQKACEDALLPASVVVPR